MNDIQDIHELTDDLEQWEILQVVCLLKSVFREEHTPDSCSVNCARHLLKGQVAQRENEHWPALVLLKEDWKLGAGLLVDEIDDVADNEHCRA